MQRKIEIKAIGNYFSLYIDRKEMIKEESLIVCEHIKNALLNKFTDYTEANEIADNILK